MSTSTDGVPPWDGYVPINPNRPLSPFAQLYGISKEAFWRLRHPDGQAHSKLAPTAPPLSTFQVRQPLPPPNPNPPVIPTPSYEDLDRLFQSERYQSQYLKSVQMWQAPVFNEALYDGWPTAYHSQISNWDQWLQYEKKLVQVREQDWFECFKKPRWFDLRRNILLGVKNPVPDLVINYTNGLTWWTVDNPVLWGYISQAIEIACRLLRQLCLEQSEWLDAVMFTMAGYIGDDPTLDFRPNGRQFKYRWTPRPKNQRATSSQLLARLKQWTDRPLIFSFSDEASSTAWSGCTVNTTIPSIGASAGATIIINVATTLRPLLEMDTTVPERCRYIFQLAKLFVHELSHAMDIGKNRGNPHRTSEAFYKDHYIAEHGYEIEMEIFGCEIRDCPETRYGEGGLSASLLINHVGQQFPSPLQEGYESDIEYNGKRAAANIPILGSLIPTFWISAMVCEKYWTDVVRRHGSRAFRPPVIFQFPIYHYWRNTKISYLTPRPLANPIFDIPELKPDYERWVTKWQERRWEWDAMRPWFNKERGSWQILPWSQFRPDIEDFLYHHTRRDLRPCRHIAQRMYEYWENRDHIADRDPVASLLRTISLLMLISLPKTPEQAGSGEIIKSVALWPSSVSEHVLWTDWKQDPADPLCGSTGNIELIRVESDMVKTLNVLMTPNGYYDLIALAETEFGKLEWILGGPLLWLRGVLDCLVTVKRERLASPLYSSWTSFPFTIPPYEPNWAKSLIPLNTRQYPLNPPYYIVTPWESAITAQFDYSPPSSPVPRPKSHFLGGVQPRSFDRSASHIARKRSHDEYLYISTVGNHRALDDAWVVEPDGTSGFDVFNISNTLKELGATENDYGAIVVVGPRGPTLIHGNGRAETIRGMFKVSIQPIGKLVQLRRIEEIAECNGQDGRPTWILWGPHVYDITNLSPQSPEEQMLLDHGAGGPIFNCLTRVNDRSSQLRTRLEPYKSGYLDTLLPNHIMRHFTPRMLRWYDSPGLGIYIALGGIVYDISDYLQFHPGGNRLLRQCTGRDATQKFEQYHHLTIMDSYEKMKVGRLVPEIEMKDMRENHVLVHDWIFDISTLAKDDPNLHQVLYPYAGVDTTDALAGQGAGSSALVTLFLQKKDLIVAGLAPGPLPDIPSGELQKHNDYLGAEGAFVSVDNLVYNVTDLIRYPEYYEWKIGPNWAGKELNFGNLGGWLRENFEARCIGKLVEGPAWAEPTADIDMRDAYPEPELRTYFI